MIQISINGQEFFGGEGQTILTVAKANHIHIPTLCHDERVVPQGACGLCVVEAEGMPRLLRACATVIAPGMIISTDSPRVRASRKSALELLLSTHTGDCRPPCALACPAHTDCQGYAALIANGQYREAARLVKETIPLPASIGRICPHPCEKECRRKLAEEPVNIAALKYFAADYDLLSGKPFKPDTAPDTGRSAAVVGGGPAGLTAAYFLRRAGHHVAVYDAMPEMGGLLRYGIPEYRLPKAVLRAELSLLAEMGIVFRNNTALGRDITFTFLQNKYDAVVIATGAGLSKKMNCPGEELPGVTGGINFLRECALGKPPKLGRRVAVVGGSNTAMDAARTAIRLGVSEVSVIYRRSREEMPADPAEIKEAEAEGVIFKFLANPIEIIEENGHAAQVRLQLMTLGEPDAGGRRSPVPISGAEEVLEADTVIAAIGQDINRTGMENLPANRRGALETDPESFSTGIAGVYAIGDVTGRSAYAIEAIAHAQKAAAAVHAYLSGLSGASLSGFPAVGLPPVLVKDTKTAEDFAGEPRKPREHVSQLPVELAKHSFSPVEKGFTAEQAEREASRCLSCGCGDYYECKLLRYANEYQANPSMYSDGGEKPKHTADNTHPYLLRNPNKCILCGLCVRICDEVMGRTALGIMGRGFQAVAAPAFDAPLSETDCNACGQCAASCPTGALQERLPLVKPLAVREEKTDTVCTFCGLGCAVQTTHRGGVLLRSLPPDDQALLCAKGRFGFGKLNEINRSGKRLLRPLIHEKGKLSETHWEKALTAIREGINAVSARYGAEAVGIAVSDRYTLEELHAVTEYAHQLGTGNVFTFNGVSSGLEAVTGCDASANRLDELTAADVILLFAEDIIESHAIAGLRVKEAVKRGAKLVLISRKASQAEEWADIVINPGEDLSALRVLLRIVTAHKPRPLNTEGYKTLLEYLTETAAGDAQTEGSEIQTTVKQAANLFAGANHAMIVFDQQAVSLSAAYLIAGLAVLAGQIGRPRAGIIQLKPGSNSQGISALGINVNADAYAKKIARKEIKALLVFGEDAPHIDLSGLEFLAVSDITLTETAERADVVLPAAAFAETGGHYADTARVIKTAHAALPAAAGLSNLQIIQALARTFGGCIEADSFERICRIYPMLSGETPILHRNNIFAFPDGKARLRIPSDNCMYRCLRHDLSPWEER